MCRVPNVFNTRIAIRERDEILYTHSTGRIRYTTYIYQNHLISTLQLRKTYCALSVCLISFRKRKTKKNSPKKVLRPNFIVKIYFKYFRLQSHWKWKGIFKTKQQPTEVKKKFYRRNTFGSSYLIFKQS